MGHGIKLIDGIGQANDQTFKMVRGKDVAFEADGVNGTLAHGDFAIGDKLLIDDISVDTSANPNASIKTTTIGDFATYINANLTGNAATVTNGVYTTDNLSVMATTTSAQLSGILSDETGTGSAVFATSPTLVTPALGTPASGVMTNVSGTAAGLTAGTVTTNANLTGHITSSGNATTLGSFTLAQLNSAVSDGTVGGGSGDIDISGTPAANQLAIWTDADTLKGDSTFTYDGSNLLLTSTSSEKPLFTIRNTNNDTNDACEISLEKFRVDDGTEAGQNLGEIWFRGQDSSQNNQDYAFIIGEINVGTTGQESGRLRLGVASYDGGTEYGLQMIGSDVDGEVDVTIGSGTASVTTIAGTLTMGTTPFVNNSGVVQVATQGTIDHDSLANFVANEHIDWTGVSAGTIHSSNIPTLNQSTTGNAATATLATTSTLVDAAAAATTYYPVLVDGLTGAQALEAESELSFVGNTGILTATGFAGALTGDVTGNVSGTAATVTSGTQASITTLAGVFTGSANQLVTDDGDGTVTSHANFTFNGGTATMSASGSGETPRFDITNTHADANSGALRFIKNTSDDSPAVDDTLGSIYFIGDDSGNAQHTFAKVLAQPKTVTVGAEGGALTFYVASNDGDLENGLEIIDGNADGELDINIGSGTASVTTIAGTLTMGSTAAMTNAGLLSVANQSNITGVGTITSGSWRGTEVGVAYGGTGQTTLADNSLLTGAGVSGIVAESNLTFDGSTLNVTGDLKVSGDSVIFESANADDPIFTLINTSNDTNDAAQMIFKKDRGVAPAVGTNLGEVRFVGKDSGQVDQEYGGFLCEIDVATDGQESGQFGIWVATHDGELQYGLQLTGGSEEDEVDVAIGQGASSLTTIAGDLTANGNVKANNLTLLDTVDNTSNSSTIYFQKDTGANAVDNQAIGTIYYTGENDIQETITYASTLGQVSDASDGAEKGIYALGVRSGGTVVSGLTLSGGDTGSEVDVSIGAASTSVTSVAGYLNIGGHSVNDIDIAGEFVDSDEHLMTSAAINDRIAAVGGGGTPTDITVANEATDTSCFPLFVTAATGDLAPKTNTKLSFDSDDGNLILNGLFQGGNMGAIQADAIYLPPAEFHVTSTSRSDGTIYTDSDGGSVKPNSATHDYTAMITVPVGYKVTHVDVYCSNSSAQFTAFSSGVDSDTASSLGSATNCNTQLDISGTPFTSTAGKYFIVIWNPDGIDELKGAKLTLAKA